MMPPVWRVLPKVSTVAAVVVFCSKVLMVVVAAPRKVFILQEEV
jgi:hypothetical protein